MNFLRTFAFFARKTRKKAYLKTFDQVERLQVLQQNTGHEKSRSLDLLKWSVHHYLNIETSISTVASVRFDTQIVYSTY